MSISKLPDYEVNVLQLSDSLFPTGMYSTSSGLETLFYCKKVKNMAELKMILEVFMEHQIGTADCVALGNSHESAMIQDMGKIAEIDQRLFSMKLVKETRDVSVRSGTQLLKTVKEMVPENAILKNYQSQISKGEASGIYPVALGVACALFEIPKNKAGLILVYAFTASVVGAALRLGIIDHFEGQKTINDLKPIMVKTVERNINKKPIDMYQFTPEIDTYQILHEQADRRMFIS